MNFLFILQGFRPLDDNGGSIMRKYNVTHSQLASRVKRSNSMWQNVRDSEEGKESK